MSIIGSQHKEEILFLKELFSFNGSESQLKNIKELFLNLIQKSKPGPKYFIDLFDYYTKCKPQQQQISKELFEYVYSCFPDQINEIQQCIQENKNSNIEYRRLSTIFLSFKRKTSFFFFLR